MWHAIWFPGGHNILYVIVHHHHHRSHTSLLEKISSIVEQYFLYRHQSFFFPCLSLSLVLSFWKETMLLFWFMYYVYRISSVCYCHPTTRPTFITVHPIIVSANTTRHEMCLLTQYWNQERMRRNEIEIKNDRRNLRDDTLNM